MIIIYWSCAVIFLCSFCVGAAKRCPLENVPLQKDFDEERILGHWYAPHWWLPSHMDKSRFTDNYAITITTKDGEEGQLLFKFHRSEGTKCTPETEVQNTRIRPGVYNFTQPVAPHYPGVFQFALTDYDQFLLQFHCFNITGVTCSIPGAALWLRDVKKLSKTAQSQVDQLLDTGRLCVNKTDRHEITHTIDCANPSNASKIAGNLNWIFIIGFVTATQLLY